MTTKANIKLNPKKIIYGWWICSKRIT
jgi:hypothetical protein